MLSSAYDKEPNFFNQIWVVEDENKQPLYEEFGLKQDINIDKTTYLQYMSNYAKTICDLFLYARIPDLEGFKKGMKLFFEWVSD